MLEEESGSDHRYDISSINGFVTSTPQQQLKGSKWRFDVDNIDRAVRDLQFMVNAGVLNPSNVNDTLQAIYYSIENNLKKKTESKTKFRNLWWTEDLNTKRKFLQKIRRTAQRQRRKNNVETAKFMDYLFKVT